MYILGINAYHGDASAVLICDGKLIAAVEEERFRRIKHVAGFPAMAVKHCLDAAGIRPDELDHIAISRNPSAHIHKKILFTFSKGPSFQMLRNRLANVTKVGSVKEEVARALNVDATRLKCQLHQVEHHRAHLASSFFVSPFEEAALLSVDGFGDFVSTMWGMGKGNKLDIKNWVEFPHSLGILYTAITQYLGFPKYGDEYKVMGLASYGEPSYLKQFRQIVSYSGDGINFKLNLPYFVHHSEGVSMTWDDGYPELGTVYSRKLIEEFGQPRDVKDPIAKRHEDMAASLQTILEKIMFDILNKLYDRTRSKKLCMAGGVALNCVVNGKIFDETPFEEVYIQPAAYDAGTALGAAYYVYNQILDHSRDFVMEHSYWGPEYTREQMREALDKRGISNREFQIAELSEDELVKTTAKHIAGGKIVGWFQGKMEFGPRALGNRSIVVDPRMPEMKDILNKRIKYREPFRPFAPSILEEATGQYFKNAYPSPFMLMTYDVKKEEISKIPAPTHVDGTGRLQTVSKSTNPLYWQLIKEFEKITGVPVVLNTSFNENEPIVCNPGEAVDCFLRTKMDVLVLGNFLVHR